LALKRSAMKSAWAWFFAKQDRLAEAIASGDGHAPRHQVL